MRNPDLVSQRSPAELFAAHTKTGHNAEADPPQLHRRTGLPPGAAGPVPHPRPLLSERLPRRLGERRLSPETHRRTRRRTAGGRAPQTGSDHVHSHVHPAFPAGAAHCLVHQLPAAELFLRLHAI